MGPSGRQLPEHGGCGQRHWRQLRLLEGGKAALANPREKTAEHTEIAELKRKVGRLERALGRKTYELKIAGELSRDST